MIDLKHLEALLERRACLEVADLDEERRLAEAPDDTLRKYRVVFAQGRGVAWDMTQTFNVRKGVRLCGIEDWVRGNLSSLCAASVDLAG